VSCPAYYLANVMHQRPSVSEVRAPTGANWVQLLDGAATRRNKHHPD